MFEAFRHLPTTSRRRPAPGLEALEDRAVPALIGGVVYHDANSNGLFEQGERGLAATPLQLRDAGGNILATATSDDAGRYQFDQRTTPPAPGVLTHEAAFSASPTDHSRTSSLPQFDPALGTLTSVEIIAEGALQSQVKMENLGAGPADVKAELKGHFTFQAPGAGPLVSNPTAELSGTLAAFDGQMDMKGDSARDFGVTPVAAAPVTATVTEADALAAYVGTGTVSVSESARAEACACGSGNLVAMVNSVASGKVKVVYHYTPSSALGPGQYTVVEAAQPPGFSDGLDTGDNAAPLPGTTQSDAIPVTITSRDQQSLSNNFGELLPVVAPPIVAPAPLVVDLSKFFFFGGMF